MTPQTMRLVGWIDPQDVVLFEDGACETAMVYMTKTSFDGNTVALYVIEKEDQK